MIAKTDPQPADLPVLDLARYRASPGERAAFLDDLRDAAHNAGFLLVIGHGVPAEIYERLDAAARRFFALPDAVKQEIENVHSPQFRGYTRTGHEYTAGAIDEREQIDVGLERPALGPDAGPAYLRLIGPNQWPAAVPELRDAVVAWEAEMLRLGRELLGAFAAALGQPEGYFDRWFDEEAAWHGKLVHYPPRPGRAQGVGPHKDYGYLTLLKVDDVGGLEVQTLDGEWIEAPPMAEALVVNIGEMLEIATQGYLRATQHRVVSPAGADRYSYPFFVDPRYDAVVEPLKLPAELASKARGVEDDPDNPLLAAFGANALLGWLRSHPQVARRWWSDVSAVAD